MRGQVSVELLIIIGVALVVMTAVFTIAYESYSESRMSTDAVKARTSLKVLKDAANYVYSQGEGAGTRVFVNVPARINNSVVSGNHIRYRLSLGGKIQDVVESTSPCVYGEIPHLEGGYWVTVTSSGDCVRFGEIDYNVVPESLSFKVSEEDDPVEEALIIYNNGLSPLILTLESTDNQLAALNQSSIEVLNGSENAFALTVDAPPGTGKGIHYERISVRNGSDTLTVEVTILVTLEKSLELHPAEWRPSVGVGESRLQDLMVCNNGETPLSNIVLSASGQFSGWVTYPNGATVSSLEPGDCETKQAVVTVPSGTPLGTYAGGFTAAAEDGTSDTTLVEVTVIEADTDIVILPRFWNVTLWRGESAGSNYTVCNIGPVMFDDVAIKTGGAGDWMAFDGGKDIGVLDSGACVNKMGVLTVPDAQEHGVYTGEINVTGGSSSSTSVVIVNVYRTLNVTVSNVTRCAGPMELTLNINSVKRCVGG